MADIIDEIINDEKDNQRLSYFRKFFIPAVVLTLVIAVFIAGYSYMKSRKEEHNQQVGDKFVEIISGGLSEGQDFGSALQDLIENSNNGVSELAKIKLASDKMQNGQIAEAMRLLQEIAEDKKVSEIVAAYSRLLWVGIVIQLPDIDEDLKVKFEDLFKFFDDEQKALYANGILLKGLFYYRVGQYEQAKLAAESVLKQNNASVVMKDQASALMVSIKYKN